MAKSQTAESSVPKRVRLAWELERTFLIFALVYFPVAGLLLKQGLIENVVVAVFTLLLVSLGLILIGKFLVKLSRESNLHTGRYGSLFGLFIVQLMAPLLMFKVFGYVTLRLVNELEGGSLCYVRYFVYDMFNLVRFQDTLTYLILFLGLVFFGLAVVRVHSQSDTLGSKRNS